MTAPLNWQEAGISSFLMLDVLTATLVAKNILTADERREIISGTVRMLAGGSSEMVEIVEKIRTYYSKEGLNI